MSGNEGGPADIEEYDQPSAFERSASAMPAELPYLAAVRTADTRRASSSSPPQSARFRSSVLGSARAHRLSNGTMDDTSLGDAWAEAEQPDIADEDDPRPTRPWSHSDRTRPPLLGVAPAGRADAGNAQLLDDLKRDSHRLAQSVTDLFASLRRSLSRSTACTREHLELYRDTSASVASDTRAAVDTATAFVSACMHLSAEVETLEHIAAQTRQVRTNLDTLELLANKVLPQPSSPKATTGGLFGR